MAKKTYKPGSKQAQLEKEYKRARKNYVERLRYYGKKEGVDLSELKPKRPKRVTEASIHKLKAQTGAKITKKAAQIKKRKAKEAKQLKKPLTEEPESLFESIRDVLADIIEDAASLPTTSSIILDNCMQMLDDLYNDIMSTHGGITQVWMRNYSDLKRFMDNEIDKYGVDQFAEILEKTGQPFLNSFEKAKYAYTDSDLSGALMDMHAMIYGDTISINASENYAAVSEASKNYEVSI